MAGQSTDITNEFFSEVGKQPETKQNKNQNPSNGRVKGNCHLKTCVLPDSPLSTWESEGRRITSSDHVYLYPIHTHTEWGKGKEREKKGKGRRKKEKGREGKENEGKSEGGGGKEMARRRQRNLESPPTVNETGHLLASCLITYITQDRELTLFYTGRLLNVQIFFFTIIKKTQMPQITCHTGSSSRQPVNTHPPCHESCQEWLALIASTSFPRLSLVLLTFSSLPTWKCWNLQSLVLSPLSLVCLILEIMKGISVLYLQVDISPCTSTFN